MIFSWQQPIWQQLTQRVQNNHLPHALLLVGEKGIGKKQFALEFAKNLLCKSTQKSAACGECQSCYLFDAETHPDFIKVEPETGQAIKIDQIREVIIFVSHTALLAGYRIIIINPASAMNANAANALLKTLEEPAPNTLLILINNPTLKLPATILSRCQKLIFAKPNADQALTWLKAQIQEEEHLLSLWLSLSQGAPLAALEFYQQGDYVFRRDFYQGLSLLCENKVDPVELAERWHEKDAELVLSLSFSWISDLLRFKTTQDATVLTNLDFQPDLIKIGQKLSLKRLLSYSEHVQKIYKLIRAGINLNQRLMFEELLIKWVLTYAVY